MANQPKPSPSAPSPYAPTSRAEKLSILSAMLGPEAFAKLRDEQPGLPAQKADYPVEIDADRAAWHRNRLLERLRSQAGSGARSAPSPTISKPAAQRRPDGIGAAQEIPTAQTFGGSGAGLDARLSAISDPEMLGKEHPAIITRLMKNLTREERVIALKSLPGPVARSIVRRLK